MKYLTIFTLTCVLFTVQFLPAQAPDTLWTKTYGGENQELGYSVQQTTDGGYIITGHTMSFGAGGQDVWLVKTDASGDTLWTKAIGGSAQDEGHSVQQTTDGGYVVAGSFWWTRTISPNSEDVWLIKTAPGATNVQKEETITVSDYSLSQNYPNPFNPSTTIDFNLPKTGNVTLKVFSILGEEVTTLVSDRLSSGSYSFEWDASNLASGVYLYRLEAEGYVETKKMIMMK
jgi:hypothetical protein